MNAPYKLAGRAQRARWLFLCIDQFTIRVSSVRSLRLLAHLCLRIPIRFSALWLLYRTKASGAVDFTRCANKADERKRPTR